MKKIVVATKNPGKIREMMHAFEGLAVELVPLSAFGDMPDAPENGATFSDNAHSKAAFYMRRTHTACLADDSGLEVDALDGAPGVYSARFAGGHADDAANNKKLLTELAKAGVTVSRAAYRCVLTLVDTNGNTLMAVGSCPGEVRSEPRGAGGFGYDPYFYIDAHRTMAELSLAEKDQVSHRGQALREMAEKLAIYLKRSLK